MTKHNFSTYSLNKLSIISLEGQDVKEFIQGQITNDINLVSNKQSIYAGYCSPKGRLIAFFHIVKFQESFLLLCPSSISTEISKKLSMYVLRSKVIIKLNPEYRGSRGNRRRNAGTYGKLSLARPASVA